MFSGLIRYRGLVIPSFVEGRQDHGDIGGGATLVVRCEGVESERPISGDSIAIEGKSFHDPMVPTGPNVREPKNRRAVIDLGG